MQLEDNLAKLVEGMMDVDKRDQDRHIVLTRSDLQQLFTSISQHLAAHGIDKLATATLRTSVLRLLCYALDRLARIVLRSVGRVSVEQLASLLLALLGGQCTDLQVCVCVCGCMCGYSHVCMLAGVGVGVYMCLCMCMHMCVLCMCVCVCPCAHVWVCAHVHVCECGYRRVCACVCVHVQFGMCLVWYMFSLVCVPFGTCSVWYVVSLVCVQFGTCSVWYTFMVYVQFGMCSVWDVFSLQLRCCRGW